MAKEKSKYAYERKSAWDELQNKRVMDFCEEYKAFLDKTKTEREAVHEITRRAKKSGYGTESKLIFENKGSAIALVRKGKKPLKEGVRIIAAHVDSPRLDLKQVPLYDDKESGLGLMETHYYGGIKKYQWVCQPLALHGVIVKKNGEAISLAVGEKSGDPVFYVADILPHLSKKIQDEKKMTEGVDGESLDIIVGNIPVKDEKAKEKIKTALLEALHREHGIIEEDFVSADLELVPAATARDVGFDKSMIGAYGQDDSVCVYTLLKAMMDSAGDYTAIAMFFDKEEIGSTGATGAKSAFLKRIVQTLDSSVSFEDVMEKTKVISADTTGAVTPNYTKAFELNNAARLGQGVCLTKYSGIGGKYYSSEARAEYVAEIRAMLNKHNVPWQTEELGRVDEGGGGTVASYLSETCADVIDIGPAGIGLHSTFELFSKADIYASYLAYKAFISG
ncbi:MAG: aminopeptidase [Candidatus Diapherotrites archaeon]|nr:aminopeptidase [Candidatus Diapherotrites archaeon]